MQLSDRGGQLGSRPSPNPVVSPGWLNNDLSESTAPTIMDPDMGNALLAELKGLCDMTGQTLSKASVTQILQAILAMGELADSGALNALVVTPLVALPNAASILDGTRLWVTPAHTTTVNNPTLKVSDVAVTITNPDASALTIGALVAGWPALVMKMGGASPVFWLLSTKGTSAQQIATTGQASGLLAKSTGNTTASVSFNSLIVTDGSGNHYQVPASTLTFDGSTTGLGHQDNGAMPTSNDEILYVVFDPLTAGVGLLGCPGSESNGPTYTGSHGISGYTASAKVASVVTDGSAHFQTFWKIGNDTFVPSTGIVTGGAATTPTTFSVASIVPADAIGFWGDWSVAGGAGLTTFIGATAGTGTGGVGMVAGDWLSTLTGGSQDSDYNMIPFETAQTGYYYQQAGAVTSISVTGYRT